MIMRSFLMPKFWEFGHGQLSDTSGLRWWEHSRRSLEYLICSHIFVYIYICICPHFELYFFVACKAVSTNIIVFLVSYWIEISSKGSTVASQTATILHHQPRVHCTRYVKICIKHGGFLNREIFHVLLMIYFSRIWQL